VRGQIISLYCNGLGPVTVPQVSGAPAGSGSFALAHRYHARCDHWRPTGYRELQRSGSGIVGEYQVNATVPTSIGAGNQPITIAIGGQTSPTQTATTPPQTIMIPVK